METIVDYALPTMMAEKHLKELHNAALDKDYGKAKEMALQAMADVRLAYQALRIMEEQ